jgi:hypothetical protein
MVSEQSILETIAGLEKEIEERKDAIASLKRLLYVNGEPSEATHRRGRPPGSKNKVQPLQGSHVS